MLVLIRKLWQEHSRPLKSRREFAYISLLVFLSTTSISMGHPGVHFTWGNFRFNREAFVSSIIFLLGWEALLMVAAWRRLLFVRLPTWWLLLIAIGSIGAMVLLSIFSSVPWWILLVIYFPPQTLLLTGNTEETPSVEFPFPRVLYISMVLALVDFPLGYAMSSSTQFWVFASVCGSVMTYLTYGRFRDVGFRRWWALPYTIIALSPYFQYYLRPSTNRWAIAAASLLLQTPAMVLPKGWASGHSQ